MIRLRHVAKVIAGQSPPSSEVVELGERAGLPFVQGNAEFGAVSPTPRLECATAPKVAQPGDVLVSVRAPVGAVNVARTELGIGRGLAAVRPSSINSAYLRWLLVHYAESLNAAATGTTFSAISASDIGQLVVPKQDNDAQRAIADYLDRETAQIDTLIEEQQRLLSRLNERRTAAIYDAVTRGLDPDAPTRRTGIDWCPAVPGPWGTKRLKYSIESATTGVWGSDPKGSDDDVLCVRVADFDRPRLRVRAEIPTVRSVPEKDRVNRLLKPGDLLIEKSGGTAINPVGFVGIFEGAAGPAVSANFLARLRLRAEQHERFWLYAHAAAYSSRLTARSVRQTTGIQNLDLQSYLNEFFPFPPLPEQRQIAEHLDDSTSRIDHMKRESQRVIDICRERRAALITAAVTGQIDVGVPA